MNTMKRKLSGLVDADLAAAVEHERRTAETRAGVPVSTSAALNAALRRALRAGLLGRPADSEDARAAA